MLYFAPMRGLAILMGLACAVACAGQGVITTVAGTNWIFRDHLRPATQAALGRLADVIVSGLGNIYAADLDNHIVVRVDPAGTVRVFAGNGLAGFSGEGAVATRASLRSPGGLWLDSRSNIYIADSGNHRIRRMSTVDGLLRTIAGTGVAGFSGDGGPATSARINLSADGDPRRGIAVDASGNIYFSDIGNHRVRKIDTNGVLTTAAGTGVAGYSGDGGPATAARLNQPAGIFLDRSGNLLIADSLNYRVRRVSPSGTITTIVGTGQRAFCGDGGPAVSACLSEVSGVYVDSGGLIILADKNNQRIRLVNNSGTISTIAGSGTLGFSGDGGPPRSAALDFPSAIFLDPSGNLVIADRQNKRIRTVASGVINTVAGNGNFKFSGDAGPATSATMNDPYGTLLDPAGNLYIAEGGNSRIRKMSPDGTLTTIAGTGILATTGDGGLAVNASVRQPVSLARDSAGNIYFLDLNAFRVRKINPQGIISTFAGTGSKGYSGDGGPATSATFNFDEDFAYPYGLAVDSAGSVYIADAANHRVRRVNASGIINTYAGNGQAGFAGDNGPATAASLNSPTGLAMDSSGNLYIADRENNRIRRVSTTGTITTIAGTGTPGFSGDGGPATSAALNKPQNVALDGAGGIYIADRLNRRVRQVSAAGTISTVVGRGTSGTCGDGGQATDACFSLPSGLSVDAAGSLYVADTTNERIRKVLTVPPTFSVAPLALRFSLTAGNPQPAAQRVSVSGSVTGLGWAGAVSTNSGGPWLSVTPTSGGVPGAMDVVANAANLAPGTYQGTVTVRAALASTAAQTVAVTLEVTTSNPARLVVDPPSLSFTGGTGGSAPPPQTIRIGNSGPGSITWTARVSTASGGNWLAVGTASGNASAATPASVSVQATAVASTLPAGVYSGTVQIDSSAGSQFVKVTLLRSAGTQTILLSQSALQFTGVEGSSQAPLQTFGVLNSGQGEMAWTVEASTLSGGAWLTVSPASGTSTAGALEIPEVEVSAKVTGLRAGQYNGLIKLVAPGAANSPQFITVELNILQPGSKPGVSVHPTGLIFAARAGASSPGSKTVRVATASPGTFELRGGLLTFDGEDWLESLPRNMLLSASDPRTLTVQPSLGDLKPGIYRAALTLLLADGSPSQVVNVLFVVNAPTAGANPAGAVAADCVAQNLYGIDSGLGSGFQARVGSPTSVAVELVDDCSNQVANATVVARFSNGDPPLALASLGDGTYSGTWRPGTASDQVTVTVSASLAPLATEIAVNGQVTDNAAAPALFSGGIVHAASFASGEALAPGSIVSAFGRKMAQSDAASAIPLPKTLGGATVTVGGIEAPLYFSSEGQINLQVPFELAPNSRPQVVIKTRPSGAAADLFTVPETITIAEARPGIFTTNQGGTGQGVVLLNDRLADAANPAPAGSIVVVYCTGLGVTQPPVASGVASPGSPPGVTTAAVTATVGGVPAVVHFAGLTPGFVGLYQVNLQIPAGVTPDGAVPLVLIQNGVASNTVTLAIR